MKTAILSLLCCLAGASLLAVMPERPSSPSTGGALILDNDQLIEGEIRREGAQVIIRRGKSETAIPAKRVIEIVADRKAAVQAMRESSNRRDPDERFRLIRWCLENNLRTEALQEAEDLLKSRPDDRRLKDLIAGLRELGPGAQTASKPSPTADSGKVIDVDALDYNPESFGMFVSRVQPILMNVCIGCHSGDKGGTFTLVRSDDNSRNAALRNLSTTLKHLNRANPDESAFLMKSITAHGTAIRPPLRDRQHPAYQNLEAWVNLAVIPDDGGQEPIKPVIEPNIVPKKSSTATGFGEASKSKPLPEPQTEAKDPFDPAIFNGTIQPKKR
jgi:hypothetical protein